MEGVQRTPAEVRSTVAGTVQPSTLKPSTLKPSTLEPSTPNPTEVISAPAAPYRALASTKRQNCPTALLAKP